MPVIPGVATKRNKHRKLTHITIDVRKHPQAIVALKELGLVPKTQFQKDCEDALSVEEVFEGLREKIRNHFANSNNKAAC